MKKLVDLPGFTVEVKNPSEWCVCEHCKGTGSHWRNIYFNSNAYFYGGLISVFNNIPCTPCNGRGTWKKKDNLIKFQYSSV